MRNHAEANVNDKGTINANEKHKLAKKKTYYSMQRYRQRIFLLHHPFRNTLKKKLFQKDLLCLLGPVKKNCKKNYKTITEKTE